jgi:hypothetical protein
MSNGKARKERNSGSDSHVSKDSNEGDDLKTEAVV